MTETVSRCDVCGNKRCPRAVSKLYKCFGEVWKGDKPCKKEAKAAASFACENAALALDSLAARLRDLTTSQAAKHAEEAGGAANTVREWHKALFNA